MMFLRSFLVLMFLAPGVVAAAGPSPLERTWSNDSWKASARVLAVQSGGRVKPLDTFAREGAELLMGAHSFQGKEAIELIFSLAFEPQAWQEIKFVQINSFLLRKDLGLKEDEKFFSPAELMHSQRLMPLFQELDAKAKAQEKLDAYFTSVQRLANQMSFLQEVVTGRALRLIPPTPEQWKTSDSWLGFDKFSDEQKLRFALMAAGFTSPEENVRTRLPDYIAAFGKMAHDTNPNLYPQARDMGLEVHFNRLHPFRWAWVLSLLAAIMMSFALFSPQKKWYVTAMSLYGATFLFQIYGFGLRCWIAGRPPVSNMYESVIWVAFGCMLFGMIFELIYRKRVIALGALIFGTIALVIADNVGGVIDDGIHPLEAVLRDNMWLTIHVLTITLGYAAFSLSMILGNLGLGRRVFFDTESKEVPFRLLAFYAYRAVQVGVILLAAGTILGGVWADYSWGRFWGWDPKETWALIALLGYLALLHARFRGMVRPFGFLSGCVVAFLGVVMAWYGVNFVLGQGKHTYGFSSGGVSYMATFCTVQLLFFGWAMWRQKSFERQAKLEVKPA
ncbi:MAG: cytochrome c biogenesis protein [Bdellovibrionota bacterium]